MIVKILFTLEPWSHDPGVGLIKSPEFGKYDGGCHKRDIPLKCAAQLEKRTEQNRKEEVCRMCTGLPQTSVRPMSVTNAETCYNFLPDGPKG